MGYWSIVDSSSNVIDLATIGVDVIGVDGVGMPPIQHTITPYGLVDGALYQRAVAQPRTMTLLCLIRGTSYENALKKRKTLITLLQPLSAIEIRHTGTTTTTSITGYYNPDNDLVIGGKDRYVFKFGIKFLCPDPYFKATSDTSVSINAQTSVSNANYVMQKSSGVWGALGTGLNGLVRAAVYDASGNLYVGGDFTTAGGVTVNYVAKWNGSAWSALASGLSSENACYSLAIGPDGTLYAGGYRSSGPSTTAVYKWTGSAWTSLGTFGSTGDPGSNSKGIFALAFDSGGNLYAGGNFTEVNNDANKADLAKWNGSTWSEVGGYRSAQSGGIVYALALDASDVLYVGVGFIIISSVGHEGVAKYNGSAWSIVGGDFGTSTDKAYALCLDTSGNLYAGGTFTTVNGITVNNIAKWNGSTWSAMGSGVNNTVYKLALDSNGTLWVGGAFTTANGTATTDGLATYSSGVWSGVSEIDLPGSATVRGIAFSGTKIALGYDTSGSAIVSVTSLSAGTNDGTAAAYPVFAVTGPGQWYSLTNSTTGDVITFNSLVINSGETITLDLTPGAKTLTSNTRGNMISYVANGSNLMTWRLLPGANTISCPISNASATITMTFRKRYWSIDGGAA